MGTVMIERRRVATAALAGLVLTVLLACAGPGQYAVRPTPAAQGTVALADAQACAAAGGRWEAIGRLQHWTCLRDYPDAGKACSDGSQCTGQCLAAGTDAPVGQPLGGTCQRDASQRFGCRQPVEQGVAGNVLCVD